MRWLPCRAVGSQRARSQRVGVAASRPDREARVGGDSVDLRGVRSTAPRRLHSSSTPTALLPGVAGAVRDVSAQFVIPPRVEWQHTGRIFCAMSKEMLSNSSYFSPRNSEVSG